MNSSRSMRFVDFAAPGGPEVLHIADAPAPIPQEGQVLIRVAAAGMNRADLMQRAGTYQVPPDASPILGIEAAGEIAEVGPGVTEWAVGDRVCSLTHGGAYAEYVSVPASHCLPVPQGFSMVEAAALPEAAMTVWSNLFDRDRLKPNESLLVHGGTGGIGTFAIQYAVAFGNRVFATAGGAARCDALRKLGAKLVIDYRNEDFVQLVLMATENRGVDVILDILGGGYTQRNLRALATEGRIVNVAWQYGNVVEIDLAVLSRKRAILTGSLLRPRSKEEKATIVRSLREKIWPLYYAGKICPVIHGTYRFEDAAAAHREMENGGHVGKIVLVMRPSEEPGMQS